MILTKKMWDELLGSIAALAAQTAELKRAVLEEAEEAGPEAETPTQAQRRMDEGISNILGYDPSAARKKAGKRE